MRRKPEQVKSSGLVYLPAQFIMTFVKDNVQTLHHLINTVPKSVFPYYRNWDTKWEKVKDGYIKIWVILSTEKQKQTFPHWLKNKKQTNNQGFYFNISNKTTEVSRPNSLKKGWHRVNPKKIRVLKYGSKYVHHKFASFTINIYRHKSVKTYKTYSND